MNYSQIFLLVLPWYACKSTRQTSFRASSLSNDAICGLSLLLVLSFAPRGFSSDTPVLPSPQKPTLPNSNSTRNQVDEGPLSKCATSKSLFYFVYSPNFVSWPGVRLYFSTTNVRAPLERPSKLQLVHARLPPGFAPSATSQRPSQVHAAFYRQGALQTYWFCQGMTCSQVENDLLLVSDSGKGGKRIRVL